MWDWKGEKLEEVKVFDYLGFRMERNNGVKEHIRERVRKARQAMGRIWSLGERRFGGEWKYRKMLFDSIVGSIVSYGAEVWGWEERKEVERLQEKHGRWALGVNFDTPGYIVREELKLDKIRVRLARRALRFEEEVRRGQERILLRKCIEEKIKWGMEGNKALEGRESYLKRCGWSSRGWEEIRGRGGGVLFLERTDRDVDRQERKERVNTSRYNVIYREYVEEEVPPYIRMSNGKARKDIARMRCGSAWRTSSFWKKEDEKICRMCREEREDWQHVLYECEVGGRWEGTIRELMKGDERARKWIEDLGRKRQLVGWEV